MSATTPIPVADQGDPGQLTTWKRDGRKAAAATDAAGGGTSADDFIGRAGAVAAATESDIPESGTSFT